MSLSGDPLERAVLKAIEEQLDGGEGAEPLRPPDSDDLESIYGNGDDCKDDDDHDDDHHEKTLNNRVAPTTLNASLTVSENT